VAETRDAALVGSTFARDRFRTPADNPIGDVGIDVEELDVTTAGEAARHLDAAGSTAVGREPGEKQRFGPSPEARAGVTRWYRLDGIPTDEQRRLAAVVADRGVLTAGTDGTVVVGGTLHALDRIADGLDDAPSVQTALRAALAAAD